MSSLTPDQKLAAYFLGRRIAGQRRKQDRVPVAYLYNGVRLPGLPENAKNYSCLVISETYGSGFYEKIGTTQLCLLSKPCVYNADDITLVPEDGTTVSFEKYTINKYTESEWKQGTGLPDNPVCNIYSPLVWANFNVYDTAGNLVLSASEPVPVYE